MLRQLKGPTPNYILGRVKLEMSSYFIKLYQILGSAKYFIEFMWFSFEVIGSPFAKCSLSFYSTPGLVP